MYSICKTQLQATTVEHSTQCYFYTFKEKNLVVAGANKISIYRVVKFLNESPAEGQPRQQVKLECLQTFELWGTVASLQKVRLGDAYTAKRDSLVISFHDAKLSIIEYDPENHDLKTVSMHYFEDEILRDGFVTDHMHPPIVRADPENRCAAMLIYGKHVVMIPLNRDTANDLDQTENNMNASTLSLDESREPIHSGLIAQPMRAPSPVSFANHIQQPQMRNTVALTPAVTPSFRSPVLPSYKVDLTERTCGDNIHNIVDIQFLHNYNDPTLVILYEPVKTWSGRIATRQDTFSVIFLSMNVHQHLQPIIWKVDKLPYDCQKILPIPKPTGGLLVFAVNELIYLNQSVEPYGVSLNDFTKNSTNFPLSLQKDSQTNEPMNTSLDLSEAVFLTPNKILLILKDGEIYLVTLFNDDMRCIKSFQFEKIASTVQPTTLTLCENNFFFVGSHVGDSVLLEYIEKDIKTEAGLQNGGILSKTFIYEHDRLIGSSASGKVCYGQAPNISETWNHNSTNSFIELVSTAGLDKHGSVCIHQQTIKPIIQDTYDLKDCDDIWTLKTHNGSISYMVISRDMSTRIFSINEEFQEVSETDCEFEFNEPTIFAGRIWNDELILQITLRGVFLLETHSHDRVRQLEFIELPGELYDATICDNHVVAVSRNGSIYHLELTSKSVEVTGKSRFILREFPGLDRTKIVAFSLFNDFSGILKASTKEDQEAAVREDFLNQKLASENVVMDSNGKIQITDNDYLEDDDIYGKTELSFEQDSSSVDEIEANRPHKKFCSELKDEQPNARVQISKIIAGDLDDDDIYGADDIEYEPIPVPTTIKLEPVDPTQDDQTDQGDDTNQSDQTNPIDHKDQIDQTLPGVTIPDECLNGSMKTESNGTLDFHETTKSELEPDLTDELNDATRYMKVKELRAHNPTYWLFIIDDRGVLEIYSVPKFNLVYLSKNLRNTPKFLLDNMQYFQSDAEIESTLPFAKEILVHGMGHNGHKPTMFLRFESELVVYEAYNYTETLIENHLSIRFKKIQTVLLSTIEPSSEKEKKNANGRSSAIDDDKSRSHRRHKHQQNKFLERRHWLKPIVDICGYNGVFLLGYRPHWLLMTHRGVLRAHPMTVDGAIYCFAPYKQHSSLESGFIYFTENKELRIGKLQKKLNLDHSWPVKKINLKETTHHVNFHVERKLYCVVTSKSTACFKMMKVGQEPDTMKIEVIESHDGYMPATIEQFKLNLYDYENWEKIPDAQIDFDEWEQVTCVKNVMLACEGTSSGLKGYIAISTNYCYGEDVANRGRIWILDLIEVVPEPDRPLTRNKIKVVYCQEQKGPVTTLTHTCGLLLSAIGQKIYLWQLKEEQLEGIAFIDTQIYINCAISVKNLILVSDICKSVSLLRYQQTTRTLSMICRDTRPLEVYSCDFVIDNEILNFIVTDSEKNIIIYAHDPEHRDSNGGTRLLRRADYHLGAHVNSMVRIRAKVPKGLSTNLKEVEAYNRRHVTMFLTIDGAFGFLLPIDESVYRRLLTLQNEMTVALAHVAGLNPKGWRLVKHFRKTLANPCKLILDGDFIQSFLRLSNNEKRDITRKIGTSVDKILADLQHIYESTLQF